MMQSVYGDIALHLKYVEKDGREILLLLVFGVILFDIS